MKADHTTARALRVSAVLIAAGISLAACGSSSSGGTSATGVTTTTPSAAATSTASTPTTGSSGGGSSSFCGLATKAQAQENQDAQAIESDTPAQLEAYVNKAKGELAAFSAAAPSAIKPDVVTVVAGADKLFAALKKAGYDFKKIDPTSLQSIDTPAFSKANDAISSYLKDKCGIDEGTG
ncbi:MAG TPA: hypothetical protein VHB69_09485 [Mycobacteriales bacterium]|nr:hypothetical protein [Mycobacteriales bacterium]